MAKLLFACASLAIIAAITLGYLVPNGTSLLIIYSMGLRYWWLRLVVLVVVVLAIYFIGWEPPGLEPSTRFQRIMRRASAVPAFILLIAASSILVSIPVGATIGTLEVYRAKRFCQKLVHLLDAYKKENGAYPKDVEVFLHKEMHIPRFISEWTEQKIMRHAPPTRSELSNAIYSSVGNEFILNFANTHEFMGQLYIYESRSRKWSK